jgi:hypothetical protein
MAASCVVALIVIVVPVLFSFLSKLSGYGEVGSESGESDLKTRRSMYATLLKTLLLEIVVLFAVSYYYLHDSGEVQGKKERNQQLIHCHTVNNLNLINYFVCTVVLVS